MIPGIRFVAKPPSHVRVHQVISIAGARLHGREEVRNMVFGVIRPLRMSEAVFAHLESVACAKFREVDFTLVLVRGETEDRFEHELKDRLQFNELHANHAKCENAVSGSCRKRWPVC